MKNILDEGDEHAARTHKGDGTGREKSYVLDHQKEDERQVKPHEQTIDSSVFEKISSGATVLAVCIYLKRPE